MTIVNNRGNQVVWDNPGPGSRYNIWPSIARLNPNVRTGSQWTYGNMSNTLNQLGNSRNGITPNYDLQYGYHQQPQYYTGGYGGRYQGAQPTYNSGYSNGGYYGGNGMWNRRQGGGDYNFLLERMNADMNAGYTTPNRDFQRLAQMAKNNPQAKAAIQKAVSNYQNTGSMRDTSKGIDWWLANIDNNGNYMRASRSGNPTPVSRWSLNR